MAKIRCGPKIILLKSIIHHNPKAKAIALLRRLRSSTRRQRPSELSPLSPLIIIHEPARTTFSNFGPASGVLLLNNLHPILKGFAVSKDSGYALKHRFSIFLGCFDDSCDKMSMNLYEWIPKTLSGYCGISLAKLISTPTTNSLQNKIQDRICSTFKFN